MNTVFRKRSNSITVPVELKKTTIIESVNNVIDNDLLFPGNISIEFTGLDIDSYGRISGKLINENANFYKDIFGSKGVDRVLVNDMLVGKYNLTINPIDDYNSDITVQPTNSFLNEAGELKFLVNFTEKNTGGGSGGGVPGEELEVEFSVFFINSSGIEQTFGEDVKILLLETDPSIKPEDYYLNLVNSSGNPNVIVLPYETNKKTVKIKENKPYYIFAVPGGFVSMSPSASHYRRILKSVEILGAEYGRINFDGELNDISNNPSTLDPYGSSYFYSKFRSVLVRTGEKTGKVKIGFYQQNPGPGVNLKEW